MDSSSIRVRLLAAVFTLAMWSGASPGSESRTEIDEIAVTGKSLRRLQREAIAAEDRFYRRFNKLNTQDDFDIRCDQDKATGTLVPKRRCRIRFLVEAESVAAKAFHGGLTPEGGRGVYTPLPVLSLQWDLRREEYHQAVRALVEKDAELKSMAEEWGRLLLQIEEVQNESAAD